MRPMKNRNEIPLLLKEFGLNGCGAEIGAGSGCFSKVLLENSDLKLLFSIDPWCGGQMGDRYQDAMQLPEYWYRECVKALCPFGLRSVVLRMMSVNAANLFSPGLLNFVYIDANHDYKYIKQDIEIWWPKISSGGILAGHDYCDFHWGVRDAVNEFSQKLGLPLHLTELDEVFEGHEIRSWLIRKPVDDREAG